MFGIATTLCVAKVRADQASFADGQSAYARHDYANARRIWSTLAAHGDGRAEFSLGLMYDRGDGVAEDSGKAFRCYLAAADEGLAEAELNVAVMLDGGKAVGHDVADAATWYARAAAHRQPRSQYNLGQLYAAGEGVPRNPEQAAAWFREAAANGLTAAASRLAPDTLLRPRANGGTRPIPPVPVGPAGDLIAWGATATAELVWLSPQQDGRTRYYVSVLAVRDDGAHAVFDGFTDLSAMLVELPAIPGDYAWRVYAVVDASPHYGASKWTRFSVRAASPSNVAEAGDPAADCADAKAL